MPKNKTRFTYWNIPVPSKLNEELEQLIKRGFFVSKSDAIRTAVREMVEAKRK